MIGIKEYDRLCNLSKNILKQRISLSNLANPFLFLVSGHPFFLSKYKQINSKNITFSFLIKFFCEVFLNIIKLFLFIFKLLLTKNFYKTENKKNKFLILSHLQNKYNFQNNIDIQYGGIEKKFPRKKTIFFYLSHIKLNENDKNNSIKIRKNYFINNDCISIYKYITIISKILKEFCFFYKKIKKTKNNFDKKFYILCVKHLLSLSTVKNLILFYNLEKLILDNKIKFILTTFEGHPYEYLVFLLGKKYSIKIFSYQHSFITSSNFSMFLNLRKDIAPNKILITGKVNYDFLKKKLNSKK